jgi:hypothetical protein
MTGTASVIQKLNQGIANRVTITEIGPFTCQLGDDWKFGTDNNGNYLESSMASYIMSLCKDLEIVSKKLVHQIHA